VTNFGTGMRAKEAINTTQHNSPSLCVNFKFSVVQIQRMMKEYNIENIIDNLNPEKTTALQKKLKTLTTK
jgi:hypothetical protein